MKVLVIFIFKKGYLKELYDRWSTLLQNNFLSAVKEPYVAAPMTNKTKIITISKLCGRNKFRKEHPNQGIVNSLVFKHEVTDGRATFLVHIKDTAGCV